MKCCQSTIDSTKSTLFHFTAYVHASRPRPCICLQPLAYHCFCSRTIESLSFPSGATKSVQRRLKRKRRKNWAAGQHEPQIVQQDPASQGNRREFEQRGNGGRDHKFAGAITPHYEGGCFWWKDFFERAGICETRNSLLHHFFFQVLLLLSPFRTQ